MSDVTLDEIRAAAEGMRDVVVPTRLVPAKGDESILLKPEIHQRVGSFKIRGVYHAVASMTPEQRAPGISTVSAGNTAQAVAWCGRHFGVGARSLMPDSAPQSKIDAVRALGGEPVLVPMDEVFRFLEEHGWNDEPYAFVHPWTSRDVRVGHGSLGLEIAEDPDVRTVFVPVGGGGLLGGVGTALKLARPDIRIVAVEPVGCPSLHASLAAGKASAVDCDTICDGVAVPYMTEEMFPVLRELADDCVLIDDADTKRALKRLALQDKVVVEPSGALAFAAALAMPEAERGRSVCLLTGGSIDVEKLTAILAAT